jgi:exopolysaccharide biosynthesis polyprenyl glycosylphosphotransferase
MHRRSAKLRSVGQLRRAAADRLCLLNDALLAADITAGTVIGYLSARLYFHVVCHLSHIPSIGMMLWRELVLVSVIASLVIRKADGEPQDDSIAFMPVLVSVVGSSLCAGTALLSVGVVTGASHDLARLWIFAWAVLFLGWMVVSRLGLLSYRRRLAGRGDMREAIALVGTPAATAALQQQLQAAANIFGIFEYCSGADTITALSDIVELARIGAISLVVLAIGADEPAGLTCQIVDHLKAAPVPVAIITDLAGLGRSSQIRKVGGIAMTIVADRQLNRHGLLMKSLMDKIGAASLLVLVAPLLSAIALAILLETGGPVIFRQGRTGWYGRCFTVFKFRSMAHFVGSADPRQTMRGDPRCTRVGRLLRRTSLDELPQLWNVLRGDMSLVGPRPHADLLHACDMADAVPMADYIQRHRVKPGLTGWAQVHGYRGATDTPEKLRRRVELDLYYIEHWSIWLDLRILARTPMVVLSAENAF